MTDKTTDTPPKASRFKPGFAIRVEALVKVGVMAYIGASAGRAAFTHMHDWTMEESPPGTPDWFGWSNAVISELIPLVALLDIRAKRRAGKPLRMAAFAVTILVVFVLLSLAAQISQAKHTPAGWLIAALPALGFLVVTKMVLTAPGPAPVEAALAPVEEKAGGAVAPTPAPSAPPVARPAFSAPVASEPAAPVPAPDPAPLVSAVTGSAVPLAPVAPPLALDGLGLTPGMQSSIRELVTALGLDGRRATAEDVTRVTRLPASIAAKVVERIPVNGHTH